MNDDLAQAARITVAFVCLYELTFVNGIVTKKRLSKEARQQKKIFDRYNSPHMKNSDRLQSNFLEWSPIFLGLLWSLAATSNLNRNSLVSAWMYIGLRALYIVLLSQYGVASNGLNKSLWISTFPAYFCLLHMTIEAIRLVLL